MYLPLTFVVAQPSPALLVAHTVAPTTTPLVAAFVTLPVICPPGCNAALMPGVTAPAVTGTGVASAAVATPL